MKNSIKLDEAFEKGYLICRSGETKLMNRFYDWCCENSHPYILVCPRKLYSSIGMDMITTNTELSDEQVNLVYALFWNESKWEGWISYGRITSYSQWIPNTRVDYVASRLVEIWDNPGEAMRDPDLLRAIEECEKWKKRIKVERGPFVISKNGNLIKSVVKYSTAVKMLLRVNDLGGYQILMGYGKESEWVSAGDFLNDWAGLE